MLVFVFYTFIYIWLVKCQAYKFHRQPTVGTRRRCRKDIENCLACSSLTLTQNYIQTRILILAYIYVCAYIHTSILVRLGLHTYAYRQRIGACLMESKLFVTNIKKFRYPYFYYFYTYLSSKLQQEKS